MIFAVSVIFWIDDDGDEKNTIFDSQWKQDGFCVANPDTLFWNSHAVCLYVDAVFAIVMGALYWTHRHRSDISYLNTLLGNNVIGVLGHGLGHGIVAYMLHLSMKDGEFISDTDKQLDEERNLFNFFVGPMILWLPLMKAAMPNTNFPSVLVCAIASHVTMMNFPRNMAFTCVQTILMMVASINQLFRPAVEKMDLHYCLYAWIVILPVSLVGWLESTMCLAFVRDVLYGHVVYDALLPASMIAFYLICSQSSNKQQKSIKIT